MALWSVPVYADLATNKPPANFSNYHLNEIKGCETKINEAIKAKGRIKKKKGKKPKVYDSTFYKFEGFRFRAVHYKIKM